MMTDTVRDQAGHAVAVGISNPEGVKVFGQSFLFGCCPEYGLRPIRNLPDGACEVFLRFRRGRFALATVVMPGGKRRYFHVVGGKDDIELFPKYPWTRNSER